MALAGEEYYSWGAEAVLYLGDFLGKKVVIKRRRSKPYRHPVYDALFIQTRTRIEAKILAELYLAGLNVPAPILVDIEGGTIVMEYIEGARASEFISRASRDDIRVIASEVGRQSALMHSMNIYHGDLTLANIIYSGSRVYIIDFGLAGYSTDVEEYAIDIHLLRRSLASLYPALVNEFMEVYLDSYRKHYRKDFNEVSYKLREVATRGRYIDRELRKSIMREKYAG